jgi:hypothetical protein
VRRADSWKIHESQKFITGSIDIGSKSSGSDKWGRWMQWRRECTEVSSTSNRNCDDGCDRVLPSNNRMMRYRMRAWIRARSSRGVVGGGDNNRSLMRASKIDIRTGALISFLVI